MLSQILVGAAEACMLSFASDFALPSTIDCRHDGCSDIVATFVTLVVWKMQTIEAVEAMGKGCNEPHY